MKSLPAADGVPAWPVLVVIADPERMAKVRRALHGWPMPLALSVATNAMAAIQLTLAQPLRLAVVDWAIDGLDGQALVRQLARLRPQVSVLAFDQREVLGPADRVLAWPWHELAAVLDRWLVLAMARECETQGPT